MIPLARTVVFEYLLAEANVTSFTSHNPYTDKEMFWRSPFILATVDRISIRFPSGAGGNVLVRVLKNGVVIAPDQSGGMNTPGLTLEDDWLHMDLNLEMEKADFLNVEFANVDTSDYYLSVIFLVEHHDKAGDDRLVMPEGEDLWRLHIPGKDESRLARTVPPLSPAEATE